MDSLTVLKKNSLTFFLFVSLICLSLITVTRLSSVNNATADEPTPSPSESASPSMSPSASPSETPAPTPEVSASPTSEPSTTPTPSPNSTPMPSLTSSPSASPKETASPTPTPIPTPEPGIGGDTASGGAIFSLDGLLTFSSFSANESAGGFGASGVYSQSNIRGRAFTSLLNCVNIASKTVWFEGPVISANYPQALGKWVFGRAEDVSSLGFGDKLSANLVNPDPGCSLSNGMWTPGTSSFLFGQVVVHSNP